MVKNEIILEINIEDNNSKKRIINSFENFKREKPGWNLNNIETKENEDEIKKCEIYINDKKIKFTYDYLFKNKGKYIIKYKFKKLLNSCNYMFFDCVSLSSLDLSNFNTQNVTNMRTMFLGCNSLIYKTISNIQNN